MQGKLKKCKHLLQKLQIGYLPWVLGEFMLKMESQFYNLFYMHEAINLIFLIMQTNKDNETINLRNSGKQISKQIKIPK